MSQTVIGLIVVVFLVVLGQVWLVRRQAMHLRRQKGQGSDRSNGDMTPDYAIARTWLVAWRAALGGAVFLAWTAGGGLDAFTRWSAGWDFPPLVHDVGMIVAVALSWETVQWTVGGYGRFGIERRFGFNRTTPLLFLADTLSKAGLLVGLTTGLAAAVLMTGGSWFAAWAFWTGFVLLGTWVYPALIAPMFNRFTPLPPGELASGLETLAERCGVSLRQVLIMDGSRRSTHGNANANGFGRTRRIVLLDTLVDLLTPGETVAVAAHELGHLEHHHVTKYHFLVAAVSLIWITAFGWAVDRAGLLDGIVRGEPDFATALAVLVAATPVFSVFIKPLMGFFIRRFEFEADHFTARHADGEALRRALLKLHQRNATPHTADPLYAAVYQSHPQLDIRLARLETL